MSASVLMKLLILIPGHKHRPTIQKFIVIKAEKIIRHFTPANQFQSTYTLLPVH